MVLKLGNFTGDEKIRSLYLQQKDSSSHGQYVYRTVPYGNHGLHKPQQCLLTPCGITYNSHLNVVFRFPRSGATLSLEEE
jgi:hypothetical protein